MYTEHLGFHGPTSIEYFLVFVVLYESVGAAVANINLALPSKEYRDQTRPVSR